MARTPRHAVVSGIRGRSGTRAPDAASRRSAAAPTLEEHHMTDLVTVTGVVGSDPRHTVTAAGLAITNFRLASTRRAV